LRRGENVQSMSRPIRITHLIVRLDTGGAEKSLFRLIQGTQETLRHSVICFGSPTKIGTDIEALGTPVAWLDYRKQGPLVLWRAWRLLKADLPDILQGWMYVGNLLASIASIFLPASLRVAWNIRSSQENFALEKWRTRAPISAAKYFRPELTIFNSHAGKRTHALLGIDRGTGVVIPNGIDLRKFRPSAQVRERVRRELKIGDTYWIALVGRNHPVKGIGDYLASIVKLREAGAVARFSLIGPGMQEGNAALKNLLLEHGLDHTSVDLFGPVDDMALLFPALDMLVLPSRREGTPNALLEAMACGVNSVATLVGDVACILLDESRQVPVGDSTTLAEVISQAMPDENKDIRLKTESDHLLANYSLEKCLTTYIEQYRLLVSP